MKKNAMLKIAAILMVAVLLTTCAISSTFAKYVTTGKGSDSARVAKWGITLVVNAKDAFANNYGSGKVQAGTATQDLVAPGTSNENAVDVTIDSDMVEVDAAVAITAADNKFMSLGTGWTVGTANTFYCPLVITVTIDGTAKTFSQAADNFADAVAFENAVNGYISEQLAADNVAINAGEEYHKSLKIGWSWAYGEVSTQADGYVNGNDVNDTLLGNSAVDHTIAFDVNVVVYQIGPAGAGTPSQVNPAN